MTTSTELTDDAATTQQVASRRHLLVFFGILVILTSIQLLQLRWIANHPNSKIHRLNSIQFCLVALVMQWTLVCFVWFGIRKYNVTIRQIIGGGGRGIVGFLTDALLGFGLWFAWVIPAGVITYSVRGRQGTPKLLVDVLPKTTTELWFWIVLACSAGFIEELIFRGYLQRQLLSITRRPATAILGQGLVFGLGHIYQGVVNVIAISTLGILLGAFAYRRQSLRPGIIAHIWMDVLAFMVMYLRG